MRRISGALCVERPLQRGSGQVVITDAPGAFATLDEFRAGPAQYRPRSVHRQLTTCFHVWLTIPSLRASRITMHPRPPVPPSACGPGFVRGPRPFGSRGAVVVTYRAEDLCKCWRNWTCRSEITRLRITVAKSTAHKSDRSEDDAVSCPFWDFCKRGSLVTCLMLVVRAAVARASKRTKGLVHVGCLGWYQRTFAGVQRAKSQWSTPIEAAHEKTT